MPTNENNWNQIEYNPKNISYPRIVVTLVCY